MSDQAPEFPENRKAGSPDGETLGLGSDFLANGLTWLSVIAPEPWKV